MNPAFRFAQGALAIAAALGANPSIAHEPDSILAQSRRQTPAPPWPAGDERGMANAIGSATFARCAWHLAQKKARAYEISHLRSNTMPLSPFTGPYVTKPKPTSGIPGTAHAFNTEQFEAGAEPGQQATQIDALGHFAFFKQPWDGKAALPADEAHYYGGFTQKDVKPAQDSGLLKLGMEKAPPIVTTAVLLDAKQHVGGGKPMKAGDLVTAKDIQAMLKAQGLAKRGILPGDVVYVHTGWGDHWKDPDTEKFYYTMAPGLSYDGAQFLASRRSGFTSYFDEGLRENTIEDPLVALAQFGGKKPCWSDERSPSGYVVPLGYLRANQILTKPPAFVEGHPTVVRSIYASGICDFGATYIDARKFPSLEDEFPDLIEQVMVVWQIPPIIPYEVLAFSTHMPVGMRELFAGQVPAIMQTEEGKASFQTAYGIEQLEPVNDAYYQEFRTYVNASGLDLRTLIDIQ